MVSPELLRRFRFFDALDSDQMRAVAFLAETADVGEKEASFFEGRPAHAVFLLSDGCVDLFHNVEAPGAAHTRAA